MQLLPVRHAAARRHSATCNFTTLRADRRTTTVRAATSRHIGNTRDNHRARHLQRASLNPFPSRLRRPDNGLRFSSDDREGERRLLEA